RREPSGLLRLLRQQLRSLSLGDPGFKLALLPGEFLPLLPDEVAQRRRAGLADASFGAIERRLCLVPLLLPSRLTSALTTLVHEPGHVLEPTQAFVAHPEKRSHSEGDDQKKAGRQPEREATRLAFGLRLGQCFLGARRGGGTLHLGGAHTLLKST